MNNVLIISGFDPSGGAGMLADVRAVEFAGSYPLGVITAVTSQNFTAFTSAHIIPPEHLKSQLEILSAQFKFSAVKIGMLGNAFSVRVVSDFLKHHTTDFVILDPVIKSTSGGTINESEPDFFKYLMPYVSIITPNLSETAFFTGHLPETVDEMIKAAGIMHETGWENVLIKGGHLNSDVLTDVLCGKKGCVLFEKKRLNISSVRGTGCWFSSLIAGFIASNPDNDFEFAVKQAEEMLSLKLQQAFSPSSLNLKSDFFPFVMV